MALAHDRSLFRLARSCVAAALLGGVGLGPVAAAPDCAAPSHFNWLGHPLEQTARRLTQGQGLTIVAIGSSSTAGAGATSPAASYPSRLVAALRERYPGQPIHMINRGVNGEEAADMVARFDADVIAERPDLVLWQVGTNSLLRDRVIDEEASLIRSGIRRLRAAGAEVVIVNPQFAPKVIEKFDILRMIDLIGATAKAEGAGLFQRFALMRSWFENERMPFEGFLSPDGLHMNDWSYACVARVLAGAIAESANRFKATAEISAARR